MLFRSYGHHFIELDASKNVIIENCTFVGHKCSNESDGEESDDAESTSTNVAHSSSNTKEAINIDTPDYNTKGFNQVWTKYDRTPNDNIIIRNNVFEDVERAVGTHRYSVAADTQAQIYHTNIQILNNTITNTDSYPIQAQNWKDFVIEGNTFNGTFKSDGSQVYAAIRVDGGVNPTIQNNVFSNFARPIYVRAKTNALVKNPDSRDTAASKYPKSFPYVTDINIRAMLTNMCIDITNPRLRIVDNKETVTITGKQLIFDDSKVSYTGILPTATPEPTATPVPTPTPTISPTVSPTAAPITGGAISID